MQKGFYTDQYESELAEKYESHAVLPIRKLITGQAITSGERGSVAAYLMSYQVRSHSMRRFVRGLYVQSSEEYINHIKETYSTIQKTLIDRGEQVNDAFFSEIAGYRSDAAQYDQWGDRHFAEGLVSTREGFEKATKLLASLKWRIFTSDSQPFVWVTRSSRWKP